MASSAGILDGIGELQNLIAREHQFADQIHELVEQAHVNADCAVGHVRWRVRRLLGGLRFGDRSGLDGGMFGRDFTRGARVTSLLLFGGPVDRGGNGFVVLIARLDRSWRRGGGAVILWSRRAVLEAL